MQTVVLGVKKLWGKRLDVRVKFENQSKRKFLPMCCTRAGSVEVEDGEHTLLPSIEEGVRKEEERQGRNKVTKDQAVQWATVCCVLFFAFNAVLFSPHSS